MIVVDAFAAFRGVNHPNLVISYLRPGRQLTDDWNPTEDSDLRSIKKVVPDESQRLPFLRRANNHLLLSVFVLSARAGGVEAFFAGILVPSSARRCAEVPAATSGSLQRSEVALQRNRRRPRSSLPLNRNLHLGIPHD